MNFRNFFSDRPFHQAFTLVELLVVLGIVAILSSLIMVVIGKAADKSKQAESASNLRQLGVAAHTYAADHNGRMLPHAIWDEDEEVNREWCYGYGHDDPATALQEGILGEYLANAQEVLRDPTFDYRGEPMEMNGPLGARPTTFGYGYNGFFLSKKVTDYGHWQGYPLATVQKPSQTAMFATSAESSGGKLKPYENIWPRSRLAKPVMRAVDGKNAIVCWVDGSVSKVSMTRLRENENGTVGHIEGPEGENLFDRFDGDTGDRN